MLHCKSSCSLARTTPDSSIIHCSIISSCQSAATCDINCYTETANSITTWNKTNVPNSTCFINNKCHIRILCYYVSKISIKRQKLSNIMIFLYTTCHLNYRHFLRRYIQMFWWLFSRLTKLSWCCQNRKGNFSKEETLNLQKRYQNNDSKTIEKCFNGDKYEKVELWKSYQPVYIWQTQ